MSPFFGIWRLNFQARPPHASWWSCCHPQKNEGGYEFGDDAHTDKLTMSMADFAELVHIFTQRKAEAALPPAKPSARPSVPLSSASLAQRAAAAVYR